MPPRKRRRANEKSSDEAAAAVAEIRNWGELPREIVAMIANYTCTPVEPLPVTCLAHSSDPDSYAYHRHEDRTFAYPGGQFAPIGAPAGGPAVAAPQQGAAAAAAGPSQADQAAAAASVSGGSMVPGTFRPVLMSDAALAMRCVCRLWCQVLSEGVRRLLLLDPRPCTLWTAHFPHITHLGLCSAPDFLVRTTDDQQTAASRDSTGADAGAGTSSATGASRAGPSISGRGGTVEGRGAGPGAATGRRRTRRDPVQLDLGGPGGSGSGGGGGGGGGAAVRSLAGLTWLRNLQVNDSAVHLDLAATCSQLEELIVCAQQQNQSSTYPGRDQPYGPVNAFGYAGGAAGGAASVGRHRAGYYGVGGIAGGYPEGSASSSSGPPGSRRSALDQALVRLSGLQRLRLSCVDASAARLCSAMMALGALTSLRLHQCRLPTFLGATGRRGRAASSAFGKELVMNLGAKLRDLSLQGCALRVLPPEVLAGLTGLRSLDLSVNWLLALPLTVTLLQQLEYLDLQQNSLTSLPDGFGALSSLADLDLSMNHLHRLPADFGALTRLTHLNLGSMHALDMEVCCPLLTPLTNLHSLGLCDVDLSGGPQVWGAGAAAAGQPPPSTPLQVLVGALAPAGRLRELLLDGCGLDTLPPNFSELTALSHLSVMENFDATGVPESIISLRNLAVLRLGYLDLSGPLPDGLFELVGLRELDLEQNFLLEVSPQISKLTALQVLNLIDSLDPDANPDAVPWAQLYRLTRLRHLSVSGQEEPARLPRGIGALTGLELLHLRGIPVPGPVMDEICSSLRGLTSLDVSAAGLTALPPSISRLTRLTELQLWDNRLAKLPGGVAALTRLTELSLRQNLQLLTLPADLTRLSRLRGLSWSLPPGARALPSRELLAWMARLPDLALEGEPELAELAKSYNIPWPRRSDYL